MNHRRSVAVALLGLAFASALAPLAAGCDDRPRPLIVADGSGPALSSWVDGRAAAHEKAAGRSVRVLRVGADEALNLATRGDADLALVPAASAVDAFVSAKHGREAGRGAEGAVRVLVVDAAMHPKVDAAGAAALAAVFVAP